MNDLNKADIEKIISQSIINDIVKTDKYRFIADKDIKAILESNTDFIDQGKERFAALSLDWTAADVAKASSAVYLKAKE